MAPIRRILGKLLSRRLARLALALAVVGAFAVSAPAAEPRSAHSDTAQVAEAGPPPINWFDFGYRHENAYGGPLKPGEEPMGPPFALMIFNFGVLLALLGWKAVPALKRYVNTRHTLIREALDDARRIRDEATEKLESYEQRIAGVDREVDTIIADIRSEADAEKQRILERAEAQARAMKKDAEERIEAEIQRARAELEREVVMAAVAVAEKLLREGVTRHDETALVDNFIKGLDEGAGAGKGSGTPRPEGSA